MTYQRGFATARAGLAFTARRLADSVANLGRIPACQGQNTLAWLITGIILHAGVAKIEKTIPSLTIHGT